MYFQAGGLNPARQAIRDHAEEDRPDRFRRQVQLSTRIVAQATQPIAMMAVYEVLQGRIPRAHVVPQRGRLRLARHAMQKGTHRLALTGAYDSADAPHLHQPLQPAGINRLQ